MEDSMEYFFGRKQLQLSEFNAEEIHKEKVKRETRINK
jgi:hypothetical protein